MSTDATSTFILTTPMALGGSDPLSLPNRLIVSPCTRNRGNTPGPAQVDYYVQRAKAGLIITEATMPVAQGYEYASAPGIYTPRQQAGWRAVTDGVHAAGGTIFLQVMNIGRVSHPMLQGGVQNYGPSAIAAAGGNFRQLHKTVFVDSTTHEPVTIDAAGVYVRPEAIEDPSLLVEEFRRAFIAAKEVGFDGVEVHGASGYLVHQFLDSSSNQRTDRYGGSAEKRCQFALEVLTAATEIFGSSRVGIKLSPEGGTNDMGMSVTDTMETYSHLLSEAGKLNLAYMHIQRWVPMFDPKRRGTVIPESVWRDLWPSPQTLFMNGGFTPEEGSDLVNQGLADAIVFGRDWIANPDLVERIEKDLPLNNSDMFTWFTPGPKGYTDYKTWDEQSDTEREAVTKAWQTRKGAGSAMLTKQRKEAIAKQTK